MFEEHAREHMNLSKTEDVVVPTVEHELSHHQCFTEYLEMFDSSLDGFLEEEGSDGPEFFQQLEECMEKVSRKRCPCCWVVMPMVLGSPAHTFSYHPPYPPHSPHLQPSHTARYYT